MLITSKSAAFVFIKSEFLASFFSPTAFGVQGKMARIHKRVADAN